MRKKGQVKCRKEKRIGLLLLLLMMFIGSWFLHKHRNETVLLLAASVRQGDYFSWKQAEQCFSQLTAKEKELIHQAAKEFASTNDMLTVNNSNVANNSFFVRMVWACFEKTDDEVGAFG